MGRLRGRQRPRAGARQTRRHSRVVGRVLMGPADKGIPAIPMAIYDLAAEPAEQYLVMERGEIGSPSGPRGEQRA
jgi:hypothetical protein